MFELLDYVLLIPLWWFIGQGAGYVLHKLMHRFFVQEHEDHHMVQYPPNDYYSREYRSPAGASVWKQSLWYAIPAVIVVAAITYFLDWKHAAIFLATVAPIVFLNQYIHRAMHIIDHRLERNWATRRWFRWIQKRHFIHHVELHKNLGMYNYVYDTILGTKRTYLRQDWEKESPWAKREADRQAKKLKRTLAR